jgi:hypothetical protein
MEFEGGHAAGANFNEINFSKWRLPMASVPPL